jgi:hypothetical protein
MDFYAMLARVIAILQREGRTSYRALKHQFAPDGEGPEQSSLLMLAIKEEGIPV